MAARVTTMAEHALAGAVRGVRDHLVAQRHAEWSDRELLEAFLHRQDEDAFAALVRRHERRVHAALAKVLSNPAEIDDSFQATFLVLVRKAATVQWQAGLGAWLSAVAHRVGVHARAQARSRQAHERQAGRDEAVADRPELSCREACALVHEELDRLPDRLRLPLLLCYLEGKSRDEAAAELGVAVGAVKGRLERGRNLLRERLTRRGVPLTAGLLAALAHSPARAASLDLVQQTLAAAVCPPAGVASLVQGVTATMILSKFKWTAGLVCSAGLIAALVGFGLARKPLAPAARAEGPVGGEPAKEANPGAKAGATKKKAEAKEAELAGRVLDSGGKPVAGAKLSLWLSSGKPRELGETGADGRFRVRVGKADLEGGVKLIVLAGGRGPDWVELREPPAKGLTLQLPEAVPIQGRVRDLEGRPIAGAVVEVVSAEKGGEGGLTPYLAAWKEVMRGSLIPSLASLPPAALRVLASVTTDKAGRFRLDGFGREQLIEVRVKGKGIEHQWFRVVNRPGFKKEGGFHGPAIDLLVGPGKEMAGVVKEKGSGKPVPGATVTCQSGRVQTDAQGRFRIEGLTKRSQYGVWVTAANCFPTLKDVKDTPDRDTVRFDVEIQRGLLLEGRLLDKVGGKGVSGVVTWYSKPDNPHLKKYSFSPGVGLGSGSAGPDGRFQILVIPGPGYLAVQADRNLYTRASVAGWDGAPLAASPRALFPYHYHAINPIDPDEKKPASLRQVVSLDPGLSRSGSMVGPDGKPVSDVIVFGLTAIPDPGGRSFPRSSRFGPPPPARQKGSTFTAVGLNPKEPRHLVFLQPEKKLGKVLRLRGDEEGPLVVKLAPLGAVSGAIGRRKGDSPAGRLVRVRPPLLFAFYKDYPIELLSNQGGRRGYGRQIRWLPQPAKTDAEGRFHLDGLISGLKYGLVVTAESSPNGIPSHHREGLIVEPGKTKDLGELKGRGDE
jgi:RNA polymerase sigma factor (sigma-70 family)